MKIRGKDGKIHVVNEKNLYIKTFYKNENVDKYSICYNNVKNVEFEVAQYSDYDVAKHMLKLLAKYNLINIMQSELYCLNENDLLKEISNKIEKNTYKERVKK